ncbi:MAG: GNAT family N-acetyltransferase [Acidimicrobiales bacterium]
MSVLLATAVTPELEALWERAHHDVLAKRGGVAMMATLSEATPFEQLLAAVVAASSLWLYHDGQLKGFALCRGQLIEAIYVAHDFRRQKIATAMVRALLDSSTPPVDAYALPGDRAMKSLYESIGWKARLLTMRGA